MRTFARAAAVLAVASICGCGGSGLPPSQDPSLHPARTADQLTILVQALAEARLPSPPPGEDYNTSCQAQDVRKGRATTWFCLVTATGSNLQVTSVNQVALQEGISWNASSESFQLGSTRLGGTFIRLEVPLSKLQRLARIARKGGVTVGSAASTSSPSPTVPPPTTTTTQAALSCGPYDVPGGQPSHYNNITVTGATCKTARDIAKSDALGLSDPSYTAPPDAQGYFCVHPVDAGQLEGECHNDSVRVYLYANTNG